MKLYFFCSDFSRSFVSCELFKKMEKVVTEIQGRKETELKKREPMDCQENDTCGVILRLVLALKCNSFISDCYGHSWLLCCLCCSVFCISLGISRYWVAGSVAKAQCPNTKVPQLQKWNMFLYTVREPASVQLDM